MATVHYKLFPSFFIMALSATTGASFLEILISTCFGRTIDHPHEDIATEPCAQA